MADFVGERVKAGDAIVDYEDKVFPDHQAEPGQKAFVFYHCVPFESSASLVNLLTATRILRKGFETHFVMFGPGSLAAAATRGMPEVDMMEGVKPINPKDVLDAAITAWKERALTLNTWTM